QHVRLVTTGNTSIAPTGVNRVYYDVYESAVDSPATFATVRRACANVAYVNGLVKLPLNGQVNFQNEDFVDVAKFNPAKHCRDFTAGFNWDGGAPNTDGGTDASARDGGRDAGPG